MKKVLEITVVSLLMSGLAIISTYPLAKNFTTGIPWSAFRGDLSWSLLYRPGDHLQLFYFFWLVKENLLGRVPLYANPYEFNMMDGITAGNDGLTTAPLAFISFLFSPLGDIAAYNCTVIASYILAGVFMYLLAKIITDSKAGSLLAAVTFTFIPIRIIGMAGGNQYGFVLFFYPMIFYFMEKCIREERILYSILAGLGIFALSFNEPHLIYYFCLCMAGYLPVRFISIIPVANKTDSLENSFNLRNIRSWPSWLSLLIILGAGFALVLYAHLIIPRRSHEAFVSPTFWWMIGYYPFIVLFLSLMMASIYNHLSDKLTLRHSLAIEALSMFPLYLLPLLQLIFNENEFESEQVMIVLICTLVAIRFWLLRAQIPGMVSYVCKHAKVMKIRLLKFLPALLGVLSIVVLNLITRTKAIAPTTESGGRTLHDVKLFSANLHDLFRPTSTVYTGLLPIIFAVIFLGYLIWITVRKNNTRMKLNTNLPLYYLLAFVLLVSHALALGLAMGNRSLYILFYHYVPFFNVPRVSDRILCVTILIIACIIAGVANKIVHRFRAKSWLFASSVLFLLLTAFQLKSYSIEEPMAITDLNKIEDGYQHIKENIGDGILLEIPFWPGDSHQSSLYQYYSTLDKIKRVNGYTPLVTREYFSKVFVPLHSVNRGEFDQNQYDLIRRLNVKYITVHEHVDVFPPKVSPYPPHTTVRRLINSPYLEYIGPWDVDNKRYDRVHEQLHVFRVKENVFSDTQLLTHYPMPIIYRVGSRLYQQTGKVVTDNTTGRKVYNAVPESDKPGFLVYGPYSVFFPGKYRCYFRIKQRGKSDEVAARIEAVRFVKKEKRVDVLAKADLTKITTDESYQDYYLDFDVKEWSQLEFRVFYYGTSEISLERIVVNKSVNIQNTSFLEAEMMAGETGRIVQLQMASGQKVVEAVPGRDMPGKMVFGPDLKYAKGNYSAIFHMKRPNSIDQKEIEGPEIAAALLITGHHGETIYARQEVKASSLKNDIFTKIRLDFNLTEPEEVSFEAKFAKQSAIQLDGIEVIANPAREE